MKCDKCGNENPEAAKFCNRCGRKIAKSKTESTEGKYTDKAYNNTAVIKVICACAAVVILTLAILLITLNTERGFASPEEAAKKYLEAILSCDGEKFLKCLPKTSERDLKEAFSLEETASVKEITDSIERAIGGIYDKSMPNEEVEIVSVRLTDEYYGDKAKEKLKKLKNVSDITEIIESSYCIVEIKYKEKGITRKISYETVEIEKKWYIFLKIK